MRAIAILWGAILLAGCGSEPAGQQPAAPAETESEDQAKEPTVDLTAAERGCPFTVTRGWYAQIENSRFSVDGQVDFQMAGYQPALKKRPSAEAGTIALDLALEAEPGAAVSPAAHYEEPLSRAYNRVQIYCGGKQVASFEPMDQRL